MREREERFAPLLTERLRAQRRGKAGRSWYVDETYLKVRGRWCYLYRAIDRDGTLVDSLLSETRDLKAARRLPACHPRDARPEGRPPPQSLFE
jgi:transposase-like protein